MAGSNVDGVFEQSLHALARTKKSQSEEPAEIAATVAPVAPKKGPKKAPASVPVEESTPAPALKKAAGKKNDPDWEGSFVFLRIDTKADAIRLLKRKRMGQDFSELCEMLLAEWVEQNS